MGRMTVTEQKLEGEFRFVNSRLITNSEEIAFYQGNKKERSTITASFGNLVGIILVNFLVGFIEILCQGRKIVMYFFS